MRPTRTIYRWTLPAIAVLAVTVLGSEISDALRAPVVAMQIVTDKAAYAVDEPIVVTVTYSAGDDAVSVPLENEGVLDVKRLLRNGKRERKVRLRDFGTEPSVKWKVSRSFQDVIPNGSGEFSFQIASGGLLKVVKFGRRGWVGRSEEYFVGRPGRYVLRLRAAWDVPAGGQPTSRVGRRVKVVSNEVEFTIQ